MYLYHLWDDMLKNKCPKFQGISFFLHLFSVQTESGPRQNLLDQRQRENENTAEAGQVVSHGTVSIVIQ